MEGGCQVCHYKTGGKKKTKANVIPEYQAVQHLPASGLFLVHAEVEPKASATQEPEQTSALGVSWMSSASSRLTTHTQTHTHCKGLELKSIWFLIQLWLRKTQICLPQSTGSQHCQAARCWAEALSWEIIFLTTHTITILPSHSIPPVMIQPRGWHLSERSLSSSKKSVAQI